MADEMATGRWDVYTSDRARKRKDPVILGRLKSGRPIVQNPDGSVSTHRNMVASFDGRSFVIPTMYGGQEVSEDDAVAIFREHKGIDPDTGQPMPSFDSDEEALAFERQEHEALEEEIAPYRPRRRTK